jgi:hypothetical protein
MKAYDLKKFYNIGLLASLYATILVCVYIAFVFTGTKYY